MKVLVISDSHGNARRINEILATDSFGAVIFLGDVVRDTDRITKPTLYCVKGNNDIFELEPDDRIIDIGGKLIFITHGHNYHVNSGYGAFINAALAKGVDAALCGHTHTQHFERVGELIVANPGALAGGDYGVLTIDNKKIDFELRSIYD